MPQLLLRGDVKARIVAIHEPGASTAADATARARQVASADDHTLCHLYILEIDDREPVRRRWRINSLPEDVV